MPDESRPDGHARLDAEAQRSIVEDRTVRSAYQGWLRRGKIRGGWKIEPGEWRGRGRSSAG
jgi:hypothetical protein